MKIDSLGKLKLESDRRILTEMINTGSYVFQTLCLYSYRSRGFWFLVVLSHKGQLYSVSDVQCGEVRAPPVNGNTSEIKTCKQNTAKFNSPGFDLVKDALICLRDDLEMLESEVIQPALVVPQHLLATHLLSSLIILLEMSFSSALKWDQ